MKTLLVLESFFATTVFGVQIESIHYLISFGIVSMIVMKISNVLFKKGKNILACIAALIAALLVLISFILFPVFASSSAIPCWLVAFAVVSSLAVALSDYKGHTVYSWVFYILMVIYIIFIFVAY